MSPRSPVSTAAELTDSVCGVLVQSGDITATEQATKLGLPG